MVAETARVALESLRQLTAEIESLRADLRTARCAFADALLGFEEEHLAHVAERYRVRWFDVGGDVPEDSPADRQAAIDRIRSYTEAT